MHHIMSTEYSNKITKPMTPKNRAVAAMNLEIPDMVPEFELGFYLEEEMFGKKFLSNKLSLNNLSKLSKKEKEKYIYQAAEYAVEVFTKLEYSIMPITNIMIGDTKQAGSKDLPPETKLLIKYMREMVKDDYMIMHHGDGTFSIPGGNEMYEFAYMIADNRDMVKDKAAKMAEDAIERNKRLVDCGIDCIKLASDYCYNTGPFLSPKMFEEFIQPYLYKIIDESKKMGLYTIKHTDGNIMPILNQLVECKPHALHSIDPQANVDIKEVKELVGDKVCICGNVNCGLMQTGTDEEVIASAEYCMTHGKKGGGYMFGASNVIYKGLSAERYELIRNVYKRMRMY